MIQAIKTTVPEAAQIENTYSSMTMEVTETLLMLGVPVNLLGFEYLRTAILWVVDSPEIVHMMTKAIYPGIAERHNTTAVRAERAIRHAVEVAWDRGNLNVMRYYFGHSVDRRRGKPTNSEFIATIADRLRLESEVRG